MKIFAFLGAASVFACGSRYVPPSSPGNYDADVPRDVEDTDALQHCELDGDFRWGDDVRCGTIELTSSTTAELTRSRHVSLRPERPLDEAEFENQEDVVRFELQGAAGRWSCEDRMGQHHVKSCSSEDVLVFFSRQVIVPTVMPVESPPPYVGIRYEDGTLSHLIVTGGETPGELDVSLRKLSRDAGVRRYYPPELYGPPQAHLWVAEGSLAISYPRSLSVHEAEAMVILLAAAQAGHYWRHLEEASRRKRPAP